jgi:DNA-binding transcriptional MocR family regulator
MTVLERYHFAGKSAGDIAATIEAGIGKGDVAPGAQLPPVRTLAAALEVSPATVAAAYAVLGRRGLVLAEGRRGTRVAERPPVGRTAAQPLPEGVVDLASGNPDPALLPDLAAALAGAAEEAPLYGDDVNSSDLVELARADLTSDGIPASSVAIVGGALDGVERLFGATLSPGDKVAVEDPGYPKLFDLAQALGLRLVPVTVDDEGPLPGSLERALRSGVDAFVITPRAQNPTGALLSPERAEDLRLVIGRHPDLFVVEDDHAGPVAGGAYRSLHDRRRSRWAVVRSVSKSLGPDLRLAVLAGDEITVGRVEGRQVLGTGWVSHILQEATSALLSDPAIPSLLERATDSYVTRRAALIDALRDRGIEARGRSGLNVWIPVADEDSAAGRLLTAGWAVAPGRRYRISTPPALRVTVSNLSPGDVAGLAECVVEALAPIARTYTA